MKEAYRAIAGLLATGQATPEEIDLVLWAREEKAKQWDYKIPLIDCFKTYACFRAYLNYGNTQRKEMPLREDV